MAIFDTRRKKRDPIERILIGVPIFQGLSNRELRKLRQILHSRSYEAGEYTFEYGQPGAAMFVVVKGEIAITYPKGDEELTLATLTDGAFYGELALLDDSPRSASAKASKDTQAIAFFRGDLDRLLETEPEIGSKIYKALALNIGKRLKAMNEQMKEARPQDLLQPIATDDDDEFTA